MNYTIDDFNKRDTQDQASLTAALAWASYKYYVENDPPMSDFQFDMEFKQLKALEAASGTVLPDSPTQRVGSDLQSSFKKARHVIPMQSIENVYTSEELIEWLHSTDEKLRNEFFFDEITFTYEPKYDGVSISLVYENGVLTDAVTRGDQLVGESVIENVRTIRNIPLVLDKTLCPELPEYFEVRGEILMPQGAFERLNAEKIAQGKKPFANKRNAASGSLKQLDPKVTAKCGLIVNAFAAYSTDEDFQRDHLPSQVATLALLKKLGFSFYNLEKAFSNIDELLNEIDAFNEIRTSHKLPYDCDGVVVKVNERRHQEYLGLNTTFPNWCRARKFPQEAQSTLLRNVIYQVGMTGHITPVAELDPTTIGGVVVSRASLSNESIIRELKIKIGGYVFVERAGEVIPHVSGVDEERNAAEAPELSEIAFPTECPACGTPIERKGEFHICPNHHCREQVIQRLEFWCGKDCADIRGIGPSIIEDFVDRLNIRSINDLYSYFCDEDDLFKRSTTLDLLGSGYADKTVNNFFDGIMASIERLTLDRIIGGLGIDSVGKITGRQLAEHFLTLDALSKATKEELVEVENIGEIMAESIVAFFRDEGNMEDIACLFDSRYGFNTTYQAKEKLGNALDGMTILFTGTSYRFKRDEIKEFFTGHGAKYVGSVSAKLTYLVVGEKAGQNKLDKAASLGVEIISERDFYAKHGL